MTPHQTGTVSLVGACRQGERVADGDRIEDEGLIDRCRRGDRTAFNALMRRHYPRVHAVARRLSRSPDDAADIVQEAFIAAWKQLPRFTGRASFRTWLHAIAIRQCAMSARTARRRPASLDDPGIPEPISSDAASLHLSYERREMEATMHAAIQTLPRAQREAIVLHYFGDLSCEETAAAMGTSAGTVKTHLFRARRSLRTVLSALADEENLG